MNPPQNPPGAGVFGGTFARGGAAAAVGGSAWLRAMLDVEAALARAAAATGLTSAAAADAVAGACAHLADDLDPDELGAAGAASGNPVVPLVRLLERTAGPAGSGAVHVGATSQDVLDTAAVLLAHRASAPVLADLAATTDALAALARTHRDTAMTGRTLLQQALPTTFGLRAATWAAGLERAALALSAAVAALPLQYGGAVGTLAGSSPAVRAALARELDLPEPLLAWHTDRTPVGLLAGALGVVAGAVATTALDLVLLAQSEVGEVGEDVPGRGGSSAMPHKRNPVAAVSARACAARCPGLVATLLAAMAQEHERAAGAWHSEWEVLADLLRLTGSAVAWLRDGVEHLSVDTGALRAHAEAAADAASSSALAEALAPVLGRAGAHDLVAEAAGRTRREGGRLADAVRALAPAGALDGLVLPTPGTDPGTGAAGALVDAWLASRERRTARPGAPAQDPA